MTLAAGPALAAGLVAATAVGVGGSDRDSDRWLPLLIAGAGGTGLVDDLWGPSHAKGLGGHLRAARSGKLTSGAGKMVALAALSTASAPTPGRDGRPTIAGRLRDGALIAGTANLSNLLDLRPGRAIKAAAIPCAVLCIRADPIGASAAGVLGASAAILPADLGERAMIGDCGANALGAALGWLLARAVPPLARWLALGVVVAATLASERVSFTAAIERHPGLRRLDELGRAA